MIKCNYPWVGCSQHSTNKRIATELPHLAIKCLVGNFLPAPPWLGLRPKKVPRRSLYKVDLDVVQRKWLETIERLMQFRTEYSRPRGIAWENRRRWNGGIINLTPVIRDPGRARCAVPEVVAASVVHQERRKHVVCTRRRRNLGPCVWGSRSRRVAVRLA